MIYLLVGLIVYIALSEYLHYVERKDLYDRIMAKDYTEYKTRDKPPRSIKNIIRQKMEQKGG